MPKTLSDFETVEDYIEYLEDISEESEEEQEEGEEQDVDDLLSDADLAAMEGDYEGDDESPSEGEAQGALDGEGEDGQKLSGEESEGDDTDSETDNDEEAQAAASATRRSSVGTLESVEASMAEVNTLLSDIDARRDKLEADWDDGEIEDRGEYKAQIRALREEEREANRTERQLDRQREKIQDNEDRLQEAWSADLDDFLSDNPDYSKSAKLQRSLAEEIQNLGAEQSWLDKGNVAILNEAMRITDAELGRGAKAAPAEGDKPKDELSGRREAMKGRGKRPKVPNTLGGMPAAEESPVQRDEFSALDALNGDALEDAMARMSPAKYAQYMEQASV